MTNRAHFVYWLFDVNGVCLYVGMTRKPEQRWAQHRAERPSMFKRVSYRRMAGPFDQLTARRLEREQQDALEPTYDGRLRYMRALARRHCGLPAEEDAR